VKAADAVFIALGTSSRRGDGHADLSFVYDAARAIAIEDRYLKTEAMIDARIVKIMAGLVGLKEYKKIYGQKPIEALPARRGPDYVAGGRAVRDTDEQAAPTANTIKKREDCATTIYGCIFWKRRDKPPPRSLARCRSDRAAALVRPCRRYRRRLQSAQLTATRFASTCDNAKRGRAITLNPG
jgi:hypothetical protein